MKTLLIGNGYWGSIVKSKLEKYTELLYTANSNDDIDKVLNFYNDVDYVFICTPTSTHYDIVKKCIFHKKNIFCEKPFTGDIKKAKELYNMSDKNNVKIFVDNIFLYRTEFINIEKNIKIKEIKFVWNKFEQDFKESLFDQLLYHDLYLLIELINSEWDINLLNIDDKKLSLILTNGQLTSKFEYNRSYLTGKEKKIIIDDFLIDFSTPLNDPLSEIINSLIYRKVDFEYNKKMTINTIELLNKIKNKKYENFNNGIIT
jgi:hypothetical protein